MLYSKKILKLDFYRRKSAHKYTEFIYFDVLKSAYNML